MPTISSLGASQGKTGDTLVINGTGLGALSSTVTVNFGTKTVSGTVTTANAVASCTVPVGCAGQVNVSVTVAGSTSNTKPFFYVAGPVCSAVSVNTGPVTPTVPVTITGTGLAAATGVTFGTATAITTFTKVGDTQISVTPPTDPAAPFTGDTDTVDVSIASPGGTSVVSGGSSQFTYYKLSTVTDLSPTGGSASQDGVAVNGTSLVDVSAVTFTDQVTPFTAFLATNITSVGDTQALVTTPSGLVAAHTYNVSATTPGGTSTVLGTFAA